MAENPGKSYILEFYLQSHGTAFLAPEYDTGDLWFEFKSFYDIR